MDIQLTTAQRLEQEKINGFITDLERLINQGNGAPVSADLGAALNDTFSAFDRNIDRTFSATELTSLSDHLRQINTNQNIAQLFTTDGELNRDTTCRADISGNGDSDNNGNPFGQNDFAALQQIIASKSLPTDTSQTVTPASSNTVSAGVGNPTSGGINHFNGSGSFFVTEGGFTILTNTNVGGHQTDIYDNTGRMITRIWGDPHVGDGTTAASGWNWHFGNDSTFILPDGTEIMFNTEGNASNNVYITTGLYIKSGNDVYQTGQDFGTKTTGVASDGIRNSSITKLAMSATEFDARYADAGAAANGAGVFAWTQSANNNAGGWAILTEGGVFQDVKNEDWYVYLEAGNASFNGQYDERVSASKPQMIAALDGDAVRSFNNIRQNTENVPGTSIKPDDLFLTYYFTHGANTEELRAFSDMVANGSSADKMGLLNEHIMDDDTGLTDEQERIFLRYLVTPATADIAEAYLTLIEEDNENDPEKLAVLHNLFTGQYGHLTSSQQNIILDYLTGDLNFNLSPEQEGQFFEYLLNGSSGGTEEDNTFLNYLITETNPNIAQTYADILNDTEATDAVKTAKLAALAALAAANNNGDISSAQENKFLDYLRDSSNANIAESYLGLVQAGANASAFSALDTIFTNSGSISEVVDSDDLSFISGIETLSSRIRCTIDIDEISSNLENASFDDINAFVNQALTIDTTHLTPKLNIFTLFDNLGDILADPVNANIEARIGSTCSVLKERLLNLQINALRRLNPQDSSVTNKLNSLTIAQVNIQNANFASTASPTEIRDQEIELIRGRITAKNIPENLAYFEDYLEGRLVVNLSNNPEAENKLFSYLENSNNTNIAKSYIGLVQAGPSASASAFSALDTIFTNSGSISEVVDSDDLRFVNTVITISSAIQGRNMSASELFGNLENVDFDHLNTLFDSVDIADFSFSMSTNSMGKVGTLINNLTRVLGDPTVINSFGYYTPGSPMAELQDNIKIYQRETLEDLIVSIDQQIAGLNDDDDAARRDQLNNQRTTYQTALTSLGGY